LNESKSGKKKIKLILVDDHAIVRDGLKSLLKGNEEIEIIGEADCAEKFFELLKKEKPDLVLLDISLPDISGIEVAKKLHEKYPEIGALILSMYTDEDFILNAVKVGARGYLPKNSKKEELLTAIKTVYSGEEYFSNLVSKVVANSYLKKIKGENKNLLNLLTEREKEIMKLVVEGLTNQEIAQKLFISIRTVETHKTRILQKLGFKSIVDLVKFAIKNKIVDV